MVSLAWYLWAWAAGRKLLRVTCFAIEKDGEPRKGVTSFLSPFSPCACLWCTRIKQSKIEELLLYSINDQSNSYFPFVHNWAMFWLVDVSRRITELRHTWFLDSHLHVSLKEEGIFFNTLIYCTSKWRKCSRKSLKIWKRSSVSSNRYHKLVTLSNMAPQLFLMTFEKLSGKNVF